MMAQLVWQGNRESIESLGRLADFGGEMAKNGCASGWKTSQGAGSSRFVNQRGLIRIRPAG
jgi:hypothetical protein